MGIYLKISYINSKSQEFLNDKILKNFLGLLYIELNKSSLIFCKQNMIK
jgi:hypothetical protein